MTESSYLDPTAISAQCTLMREKIARDQEALDVAYLAVSNFVSKDELKSEAFSVLKSNMDQYLNFIGYLKAANQCDVRDLGILTTSVGNEVLDGKVILKNKKDAWDSKVKNEELAESYSEKAASGNAIEAIYYSAMATYHSMLANHDYSNYLYWKGKEERYDEIEESTKALFDEGFAIRSLCMVGGTYPGLGGKTFTKPGLDFDIDNPNFDEDTYYRLTTLYRESGDAYFDALSARNDDPTQWTKAEKDFYIAEYEKRNQGLVGDVIDSLSKAGYDDDVRNIKVLIYTTEEPYRSAFINNVYNVSMGDMHYKGTAYYAPGENAIYLNVDEFHFLGTRASNYRTFFHEMSHAADHNYSNSKNNSNVPISKSYADKNGKTFGDYIKADVENTIRTEVDEYIEKKNLNLTAEEKKKLEDDVTHLLMNTADYKNNPPKIDDALTKKCYKSVRLSIEMDLIVNGGIARDMYGGYTGNSFPLDSGHYVYYTEKDLDFGYYWVEQTTDSNGNKVPVYDENGNIVYSNQQPVECFAECMAGMITDDWEDVKGYNYYSEDVQNTFNDIASEMAGTN